MHKTFYRFRSTDKLLDDEFKELENQSIYFATPAELSDGGEIKIHGTNPNNPDTDGDILPDGWEVSYGHDPLEDGTKDHPYDAIQKAIDSASAGGVIVVLDGTYGGVGNREIRFAGKSLLVQSLNGTESTLVENTYSAFICDASETTNSIIKGFSIHTWKDFFGLAGIVCDGANPMILDCRMWDCGEAGVLCTNGANSRIEGCEIVGNAGGVRSYGSSPIIESCSIVSNTGTHGAGLFFEASSSAQVVNCLITENKASEEGGGAWVGTGTSPEFIHCTFAENGAGIRGGGISTAGTPLFRNSIVYDNVAPESSGIFYSAALDVQYTCLQEFYPGIGNSTTDPSLVPGTFSLSTGSVAIDMGTRVYGVPFDLVGTQRPLDGTDDGAPGYDLGAYEFVHGSTDTDGDKMPDYWELDHLFNPTSDDTGLDSDGDGQDNHAEYITGLDPNDRTSFFAVASESQASGFVVQWPSVSARWYDVLWTPNLTNDFQSLDDLIDHPQSNYTDSAHNAESAGFYKVEVRLK